MGLLMANTLPVDRSVHGENGGEKTPTHVPPSKRKPPVKLKRLESAPLDANLAQPLEKRIETHRHKACTLADRLAEEIRLTLDSGLAKKEKARLVRELTWSYGVLFDKASGGESSSVVKIQLPADVLGALKIGIALQLAPKAQAVVAADSTDHNTLCVTNSLSSCESGVQASPPLDSSS